MSAKDKNRVSMLIDSGYIKMPLNSEKQKWFELTPITSIFSHMNDIFYSDSITAFPVLSFGSKCVGVMDFSALSQCKDLIQVISKTLYIKILFLNYCDSVLSYFYTNLFPKQYLIKVFLYNSTSNWVIISSVFCCYAHLHSCKWVAY